MTNPELKTVPVDDPTRPFSDSLLPEAMIVAGMDALGKVDHDAANYVSGETIDWDQGMIAVAVYRAMTSAPPPPPVAGDEGATLQARVQPWMMACFGPEISADEVERGDRLLEEVFEALQSRGYDPDRVASLRDYVWSRPVGETVQEVGGVMITLAAFCLACGVDMHAAGETELARIWTKVEKIRAKQAAKPRYSPLPQAAPSPPPADLKASPRPHGWLIRPNGDAYPARDEYGAIWTFRYGGEPPAIAGHPEHWDCTPVFTEESLSAAHAAGKAEGEAEITRIRAAHALTEKDACDGWEAAGIRTQERNDWMHRAHDAHATARAEALQEAAALCAKHVSSDVWHNGGYMSTYLAERIRALIPAPLPPREENNG